MILSDRWSLALLQKTHVLSGENQARVVAIDPGVRIFAPLYVAAVVGPPGRDLSACRSSSELAPLIVSCNTRHQLCLFLKTENERLRVKKLK
jgi:hypothetical protein